MAHRPYVTALSFITAVKISTRSRHPLALKAILPSRGLRVGLIQGMRAAPGGSRPNAAPSYSPDMPMALPRPVDPTAHVDKWAVWR